jgi:hypothetical protein
MNNQAQRRKRVLLAIATLGLILAPGGAMALQCHVGTIAFHPEGGIKSCEIEANHEFRTPLGATIVCGGGAILTQHPDGSIESCTLAKPYAAKSQVCAAGKRVALDPGGRILGCE